MLEDPLAYLEPIAELAVRLLRNLCARSEENQDKCREIGVHKYVVRAIVKRLEMEDGTVLKRVEGNELSLALPWFGYATEFLVNFVTCNEKNANEVWKLAFPDVISQVLESENVAAAAAAAALIHNCVAVVPERMVDVVKVWDQRSEKKSVAMSLLKNLHESDEALSSEKIFESFSWAFLVIRRLIAAGMVADVFQALGPSLEEIVANHKRFIKNGDSFSPFQITLLGVIDAALAKSAESLEDDDELFTDMLPTPPSLDHFVNLFRVALTVKYNDVVRLVANIAGSVIILLEDSDFLNGFKFDMLSQAVERFGELSKDNDKGLRVSLVRLVALAADRDKTMQDLVRQKGGIPHILNAMAYEKDPARNPFMREWAVLAIRNLTENNQANVNDLRSYELVDVVDNQFLQKAGLEAYVDPTSGRPRVRPRTNGA